MPNNIKVSDMEEVTQLTKDDLVMVAQPNIDPEDPTAEVESYSSKRTTVEDLANTAAKDIQFTSDLDTDSKNIIGAINEAAAVSKLSKFYSSIYFDYNWAQSGQYQQPSWDDIDTTPEGQKIYQSEGGTYLMPSGNSLGTYTVEGYDDVTFYIKQDDGHTDAAYIVLGKPNATIDLEDSDTYIYSGKNNSLTEYTAFHFENLYGNKKEFQVLYRVDSAPASTGTATIDLNNGQWVDSGTEVDGHTVYKSTTHTDYGTSLCTINLSGVKSISVYCKPSSESGYDITYLGELDSNNPSSDYEQRFSGIASEYEAVNYIVPDDGEDHFIKILYKKDSSSSSGDDCGYIYFVVNGINEDRGYIYIVPGTVHETYIGEVFNNYNSNFATGQYSHAEGNNTLANSYAAHAEGYGTKALYSYSHAEGNNTLANGHAAHAEGNGTEATHSNCHAEGDYTKAYGDYSHAEGEYTEANGSASHAEGYYTKARSHCSHAEGYETEATGYRGAHAEGQNSHANGTASHSEGYQTQANGENSHVEGYYSIASGFNSHAEGYYANAIYSTTHAEGRYTLANAESSHAEGYGEGDSDRNIASGSGSHTEGYMTTASAKGAHAEGSGSYNSNTGTYDRTIASGQGSHAEGYITSASGIGAHSEGKNTQASGEGSHAEGLLNIASGVGAHAEGMPDGGGSNIASGKGSHAEGSGSKASGHYSHAEGAQSSAIGQESHAEGGGTNAYGGRSHSEGAGNSAYSHCGHAEGAGSYTYQEAGHVEGAGNINSAAHGHVEGSGNRNAPSAYSSHVEGGGNTSWGSQTHIEGGGNYISGQESHAEGGGNTLHGYKSHIEGGGNKSYGMGSHVEGKHNLAVGYGLHAEGMQNAIGVETATEFSYGTSYLENDVVVANAVYTNIASLEEDSAFLFKCKTEPGQIQAGDNVEIITPTQWSNSASYTAGAVVYRTISWNVCLHFYTNSDVSAGDDPLINNNSKWNLISNYLSPLVGTTTTGYYLLNSNISSSSPVAHVTDTVEPMWEKVNTPFGSHVEGLGNIATGDYQHVGGKYNTADANKAFIIGNGTKVQDTVTRSNALTVDWNGNMVLAGDITPGTQLTTTAPTLAAAINELAAKIPAPPTTDGTYTLSVTVSSGVPTYSWV